VTNTAIFDDFGIRFEYPMDWELDVSDDGGRTTVSIESPGAPAFVMVAIDEDRPQPAEVADEALEAMKGEYPDLEAVPALETIDGHRAIGHDLEFFSLDMASACAIRCFRTRRRTVLVFAQWTDLDDDLVESQIRAVRTTLEETDA
jgi:hypothetical protein